MRKLKKHQWAICYSLCLALFTTYIALDTFVLQDVQQTNATAMNMSLFESSVQAAEHADEESTDQGNEDENNTDVTVDDAGSNSQTEKNASAKSKRSSGGSMKRRSKSSSGSSNTSHSSGTTDSKSSSESKSGTDTEESTNTQSGTTTATAVSTGNSYQDENIQITLSEYRAYDTTIYVADVTLSSAAYLKTAFANDTYGKNVTAKTSTMAAANDAILAINGDYYGAQEKGYVIRNGIVYRDKAGTSDVLCIYADGRMEVVDPSTVTAEELVEKGVWQAFSFGPGLIEDG